jgi:hypothetical protein
VRKNRRRRITPPRPLGMLSAPLTHAPDLAPSPPQVDDTDVINFLLSTEIIPLCLRTMEMGSELSKTVATFIVQKILLDDVSLGVGDGRLCGDMGACYEGVKDETHACMSHS